MYAEAAPDHSVTGAARPTGHGLPEVASVLAVCAHPDDESFGLGALLAAFGDAGSRTTVLCFTHGEASTLGDLEDLHVVRALLDHADGALAETPMDELVTEVRQAVDRVAADLMLVFDQGGITGHADHRRATRAALVAASEAGAPVLAWALEDSVAAALNHELASAFVGRERAELDAIVTVDRTSQLRAIACHTSQSSGNPVLWRRLELQGNEEAVRWLRR
jgi:N-acetylglucosamine malate deacetylase 2